VQYKKKIQTQNLIIGIRVDDILETRTRKDWDGIEGVDHARENMAAIVEISNGVLYPTLNFLPDHKVTDEAQIYYKNHPPAAIASAMIARSMMQMLLGNIFIKVRRLSIPTKLFTNVDDAVIWLNMQRHQAEQKKHRAS
jgi:hypothetical protein